MQWQLLKIILAVGESSIIMVKLKKIECLDDILEELKIGDCVNMRITRDNSDPEDEDIKSTKILNYCFLVGLPKC